MSGAMDAAALLATFVAVQTLATVSPGPAFMIVAKNALGAGRFAGIATAMGCAVGALIWITATLAGIEFLVSRFLWLYWVLKVAGGAFLIYLAVMMWRHAADPLPLVRPAAVDGRNFGLHFLSGLVVQLTNPKALAYCMSVLITLVPPTSPDWYKAAIPAIGFTIELLWWTTLALAFSYPVFRERYGELKRITDRVIGALLGGLGVRLLTERP